MVISERFTHQSVLSGEQRSILQSIVRKTHCPKAIATRAGLVLAAAEGRGPSEAAREFGCSRGVARLWPQRFAQARHDWGEAAEGWDQKVLADKVLGVLEDRERSGTPPTFTPEQLCRIMAVAVEKPEECGRPISHWTARELAEEAERRQIVPAISPRHVGRFLKKWTCGPTRRGTGSTARTRS